MAARPIDVLDQGVGSSEHGLEGQRMMTFGCRLCLLLGLGLHDYYNAGAYLQEGGGPLADAEVNLFFQLSFGNNLHFVSRAVFAVIHPKKKRSLNSGSLAHIQFS